MSNVLHRTTKQFLSSVNEPDYPKSDWIHDPDITEVEEYPTKYWIIDGDDVSLMNEAGRSSMDEAERLASIELNADLDNKPTELQAALSAIVSVLNSRTEIKTKITEEEIKEAYDIAYKSLS